MSERHVITSRQAPAACLGMLPTLASLRRARAVARASATRLVAIVGALARYAGWPRLVTAVALTIALGAPAAAATYTSSGPGNWDNPATWGGSGPPTASDSVSIGAHAISLNGVNRSCVSVTFTGNGSITGANTLTLTGTLDATGTAAPTISCSTVAWGGSLAAISNSSSGVMTISAAITGTAGLTKTGSGVVALSANNSGLSGTITASAGTLRLSGANGSIVAGTSLVIETGGTFDIDSTSTSANRIADAATVTMRGGTFSWSTSGTVSETISAMAFTKGHSFVSFNAVTGSPTLTASNAVSRSNAATMELNRGASPYGFLKWTGTATGLTRWTVVEQGGFVETGTYDTTNGLIQPAGIPYTVVAQNNFNDPASWSPSSSYPQASDHVLMTNGLKPHLATSGGVNPGPSAITTLYSNNNNGTPTGMDSGAVLTVNGNVYARGTGRVRPADQLTFGANEGVFICTGTGATGIIANWGDMWQLSATSVTVSGTSVVEFNDNLDGNANSNASQTTIAFNGAIAIAGGTCRAGWNAALGTATGATTVYDGATLEIGNSGNDFIHAAGGVTYSTAEPLTLYGLGAGVSGTLTNSFGDGSFAGPITLGSAVWLGAASGTTFTLSGQITGGFTVGKVGAGILSLTNANNTFTGPTTVNAGTLQITSGTTASAVTLNGGNLRGGGTIGAVTTTGTGGTIAPGTAAAKGILTTGAVNLSAGTTANVSIRVAGVTTAGTDYDKLACGAGTLTLGGSSSLTVDVSGTPSGTISICTAGSVVGRFATVTFTNGWGLVTYTPTAVQLTVANCLLEYKLDASSGTTVVDTSGNGFNGTLGTTMAWDPTGGWNGGCLRSTLTSTPVWDRAARGDVGVAMPTAKALQPGWLGVSLWVKRTASWNGTWQGLIDTKVDVWNGNGWYIEMYDADNVSHDAIAIVTDGGVKLRYQQLPDTFYPLNEWVHLFVDYQAGSPSTCTIYKNGVALTGLTTAGGTPTTLTAFDDAKAIHGFQGSLDLVRIYNSPPAGLAAVLAAEGASVWDGGGADSNTGTAANWVGDVLPGAGDNLVFTGALRTTPVNTLSSATAFQSLIFTAGGFTLTAAGANPITLANGIGNQSGSNTVALPITLAQPQAFTADSGTTLTVSSAITNGGNTITANGLGTLTVSGAISGSGGFTQSGAGTSDLSSTASAYSGTTTVSAGILRASNDVAASGNGPFGNSAANIVATGGTLQINTANFSRGITVNGGTIDAYGSARTASAPINATGVANIGATTVASAGGQNLTLSGAITGAGSLVKTGNSTAILSSASNAWTGGLTVSAGTVQCGAASVLPPFATAVASGATLDLNTSAETVGALTGLGTVTSPGAATFTVGSGNVDATFDGVIAGAVALTKTGTGSLTLNGTNTFSGVTNVNAGTIVAGTSSAFGGLGAGTVVAAGATVRFNSAYTLVEPLTISGTGAGGLGALFINEGITTTCSGAITLSGSATIRCESSGTCVPAGGIGGTGSLVKSGLGTVSLAVANGYTGSTTVDAGTLLINGSTGTIVASSGVTINAGATLSIDNSGVAASVNRIADTATVTMNGGAFSIAAPSNVGRDETIGVLAVAGGSCTVTASSSGTGIARLIAQSGFSRASRGTLVLNRGAAAPYGSLFFEVPAGTPFVANGTLLNWSTVTQDSTSRLGQYSTANGLVQPTTGTIYTSNNSDQWVTTTNWTPNGLPGANDEVRIGNWHYVGLYPFDESIRTATWLGNGMINQGQTLTITGAMRFEGSNLENQGGTSASQQWTTNEGIYWMASGAYGFHYIGSHIYGSNGITKSGPGVFNLNGYTDYSGLTTVDEGIVRIASNGGLGDTATGTIVRSGGSVDLVGVAIGAEPLTLFGDGPGSIGALRSYSGAASFAGAITLGGDATIASALGSTLTVSGGISGGSNLTELANGTIIPGSANSYTGTTTLRGIGAVRPGADVTASANGPFGNSGTVIALSGATIEQNATTFSRAIGVGYLGGRLDAYGSARTMSAAIAATGPMAGLRGTYFNSSLRAVVEDDWRATRYPTGWRQDATVYFPTNWFGTEAERTAWSIGSDTVTPANGWSDFSVQWDGWLTVKIDGTTLKTWSDDGSRVWLDLDHDGVIDDWDGVSGNSANWGSNAWGSGQAANTKTVAVNVPAGTYRIRVQYEELVGGNAMALTWTDSANSAGVVDGNYVVPSSCLSTGLELGGTTAGGAAGQTLSLRGVISGAMPVAKVGTSRVVMYATNTYTGATTVERGTLALGTSNVVPDTELIVGSGATFDLASCDETVGSLAGAGSVTCGSGRLTTGGDGLTRTFSGVLSGTGGLTMSGTGTETLSGTSTCTGRTNVAGGTLIVNGSLAASTVAITGGTLRGTGTVGPILASGGTVKTGSATAKGILAAGASSFATGATVSVRVAAFATPGTDYDRLNLGANALTIGGNATLEIDLAGVAASGTATGVIACGSISGRFSSVSVINGGGYTASVAYTATTVDVVVAPATGSSATTGLIAWYKLDESVGTFVADSSGNGHSGVRSGGSWSPYGGAIGGALGMPGATDIVTCDTSSALVPSSLTISFWIKRTTSWATRENIVFWAKSTSLWDSTGWYVATKGTTNQPLYLTVDGGNGYVVSGVNDTFYPLNTWVHMAVTYSGGACAIYKNGVAQAVSPFAAPVGITANTNTHSIGTPQASWTSPDLVDDIRIYGSALSPAAIAALAGGRSTRTWDGGSTVDSNWQTAANWAGDVAPNAGDDLVFAGTTRPSPADDFAAATAFNSLSFTSSTAFSISGANSIALTAGISASAGSHTVAPPLTLAQGQVFSASAGATLTVNGAITNGGNLLGLDGTGTIVIGGAIGGAGGLAKNGTGTATLSAANGYTGATTVNAGTLYVNGAQATSAVTITGGTLGGTGTVGAISATGGTIFPGGASKGILTAGACDLSGGSSPAIKLRVAAYATAGTSFDQLNLGGAALTLGGSAKLIVDLSGVAARGTATNAIACGSRTGRFASIQVLNPGAYSVRLVYKTTGIDVIVDDPIAHWRMDEAGGSLVSDSTGHGYDGTIVAGTPTWLPTGGWLDGALKMDGTAVPITVGTSTNLQPANLTVSLWVRRLSDWSSVASFPVWCKGGAWNGTGWYLAIQDGSPADHAFGIVVSGDAGCYINADANTFFPYGQWVNLTATWNGTAAAVYKNGVDQGGISWGSGVITSDGGTKQLLGGTSDPVDNILIYGRVLSASEITALASEGASTWDGTPSADSNWMTAGNWVGDVAPTSEDNLVFTGALKTTNSDNFPTATRFGSLTFNAGGFVVSGASLTVPNGLANTVGSNSIADAIVLSADQTWGITASTTLTASGVLSGTAALTKGGGGRLILGGANTASGAITVTDGVLQADNSSSFGSTAGATAVTSGGAIELNSVAIGAEPLSLAGTGPSGGGALVATATSSWAGPVTLTANSLVTGGPQLTLSGTITGAYNLSLAGLAILSGTGSTWPSTTITSGTVRVAGGAAIPDANAVTLANVAGAVLDLNNTSETIGSLAGGGATGGNVTLGTGTLTLADSLNTTYSGAISGGAGSTLVRTGYGITTLAGANTFAIASIGSGTLSVGGGSALADTAAVTMFSGDVLFCDDAAPAGATLESSGGDAWTWITASPAPFSGTYAHQSDIATAGTVHQHYLYNATTPWNVVAGDVFVQYVYLDPVNTPTEVLLQFNIGGTDWEHRAYWGANTAPWGVDGTTSRKYQGALPAAGGWVRLEVPASDVGVVGSAVGGIAYTLVGGRATWDYTAKRGLPTFDVAASESIGSLAGTGILSLSSGTLTIAGSSSTTYSGSTTGGGALTMAGSGVFTVSGTAAHTGATTVSAGELSCSGNWSTSPASLVGGILGGTGTYGTITSAAGCVDGVIRPGSAGARGTLRGGTTNLSLGTRPTVRIRIAGYATAGTSYDCLDLATAGGTLTLGGDSLLILDLSGLATAGTATGVITCFGACTGTFSTVQLINNPNGWMAKVDYSQGGRVDVTICPRRRAGSGAGYPPPF